MQVVIRRNFLNGKRCHTWGLDYETPILKNTVPLIC